MCTDGSLDKNQTGLLRLNSLLASFNAFQVRAILLNQNNRSNNNNDKQEAS